MHHKGMKSMMVEPVLNLSPFPKPYSEPCPLFLTKEKENFKMLPN